MSLPTQILAGALKQNKKKNVVFNVNGLYGYIRLRDWNGQIERFSNGENPIPRERAITYYIKLSDFT